MTTTAATWFYHQPETNAYLLSERVNSTFWEARLGGVWLSVERAEPPFRMAGHYNGARVTLEWEPAKWIRLATNPPAPWLAHGLGNILRRKPTLRYETPEGFGAWEWWLEGADARWQALQGQPVYGNPERLDKAN